MSIKSIRARVESATEGPWVVDDDKYGACLRAESWAPFGYTDYRPEMEEYDEPVSIIRFPDGTYQGNQDFIAHARADIPLLLKVAEAAKRELMWKREMCFAFPERKHRACSTCGHAGVCVALAELEASE